MELRFILLITAGLIVGPALISASPIKRYPLDDRALYHVEISPHAPTTVMFPGPVSGLDGAGVSTVPEDEPDVLISHQPGARYFSVRARTDVSEGAVNVIYQDQAYALTFRATDSPDRTLTFFEPTSSPGITATHARSEQLFALLDRVNHYTTLAQHYPALAQSIERVDLGTVTEQAGISTIIESVFRFETADALVFKIWIENGTSETIVFSPPHLAVLVGEKSFPVALTDASGEVPAGQAAHIRMVVVGNPDGTRANLSAKNRFSIHIPTLK